MTIHAADWTPDRIETPRYRVESALQLTHGIETRLHVIRDRTGEAIAETPHAWMAARIVAALNAAAPRRPRK